MELIVFSLEKLSYGIDATKVREILTYTHPTKLPNTKKWISGVINIRGEVTPVIDLRVRFETDETPKLDENTPIIAVKTGDGRMVGIIIDSIDTLVEIDSLNIIDMPQNEGAIGNKYLKGIFMKEGQNIALLDTDILLSKAELDA